MKTKLFVFLFLIIVGQRYIFDTQLFSQFTQQGPKLVGTGSIYQSTQGRSVAISTDGNTAIVGGDGDDNNVGAVWVFTRNAGVWTQQGSKLVGTGAVGNASQGISVAISSDGNTIIVGGWNDNNTKGAVWVFTRSNGIWTQQGSKLIGTGAIGNAGQGASVSISSDGNTAIEGGITDNNYSGAVWIFTRSGGIWTQQGPKLVGNGAVGFAVQGHSVSISADGYTAIEGGVGDNTQVGAIWVFTRSGGVWTQQGQKLVGTGAIGSPVYEGQSVGMSSDGNTFIEGGYFDNSYLGAVWVFTRDDGFWTQQAPKIVGTGIVGSQVYQGYSVAISSDGSTSIEGGWGDNNNTGAVWEFTCSDSVWTQQGTKLIGAAAVGTALQGGSVAISSEGTLIEGGPWDNNQTGAVWIFHNPTIGITPISNAVPKNFGLSQNYPNPFNPNTVIKFQVAGSRFVKLNVYDILGREVSTLLNQQLQPGTYEVNFDGTNFPSGVYYYRLTVNPSARSEPSDGYIETKKMILVK